MTDHKPAAGWYPDANAGVLRYWDGHQWTEHTHAPNQGSASAGTPVTEVASAGRPWFKKKRTIVPGVLVTLFVFGAALGGSADDEESAASESSTSSETEADVASEDKEEPEKQSAPKLTSGQENAIGAAENYLTTMAFSRDGLIEQLEFEQYSKEDATFAVDHLKPDWNEQAVKSAEHYLDTMPFSRGSLIQQLEFDGFTTEQATHGVDQAGL